MRKNSRDDLPIELCYECDCFSYKIKTELYRKFGLRFIETKYMFRDRNLKYGDPKMEDGIYKICVKTHGCSLTDNEIGMFKSCGEGASLKIHLWKAEIYGERKFHEYGAAFKDGWNYSKDYSVMLDGITEKTWDDVKWHIYRYFGVVRDNFIVPDSMTNKEIMEAGHARMSVRHRLTA